MKQFSALSSLLSLSATPTPSDDDKLELYIGRDWAETFRDIRSDVLSDGLPRDRMTALVRSKAFDMLGIESLAHCTAEVVSAVTPLARDISDVEFAIATVSAWLNRLAEEDAFERIVELKAHANEVGLDDGPSDSSPEAVAAWNELFESFCQEAEIGQICFEMGGRDVLITVEADGTLLIVETEPGTDDLEVLVCFQHSMGGSDGWDDGDDDPDPQPDLDPASPNLVDA